MGAVRVDLPGGLENQNSVSREAAFFELGRVTALPSSSVSPPGLASKSRMQ